MNNNNQISISVLKGDKLFNENTPFVINVSASESKDDEKKSNADLICVIDISGSMGGEKIYLVKESLKILIEMMDKNDRLALVLFDNNASTFYDLNYMTDKEKSFLQKEIEKIDANGGTNILSGLEEAVKILKRIKDDKKANTNRASSIILLSDGCDNYSNDIMLAESLKKLTKGLNLTFTLNTFGYGYDHDPKIMNKLANIRDGSFFLVEDYKKVSEYFVSVLGGCVSVISKKVDLCAHLLNKKCKMIKIFGEENLYSYELKPDFFKTSMLQFICGKEYTFVLEINIDEKEVKIGEDLLNIDFIYEDISNNDKVVKINYKYKYELTDIQISKANDEYIRSQVYFVLAEALKLREKNENSKAKKLLEDMEAWLKQNHQNNNKSYLEDILKAKNMFNDEHIFRTQGISYVSSNIRERQSKRAGTTMMFQNRMQVNFSRQAKAISANNKFI